MQEVFSNIIEELEIERTTANNTFVKYEMNVDLGRVFGLEKAIEIVKQETEKYNNGWIPCSERLPKENGMYLCTQNSYDLATNKNLIRISTELVEFYNGKWRRAKNLVITHWQPLPQPYQPKGDYDENTN